MNKIHTPAEYAELYRNTLLNDVVPFWEMYAIDATGAINNCINNQGEIQSKQRYIWSQGRALWTFSALHRRVEPRDNWLAIANGIFEFLLKFGRNSAGNWNFLLDENGAVIEGDTSIFVDGYAANGLTEYWLATKNPIAETLLRETCGNIIRRLRDTNNTAMKPFVLPPKSKPLGSRMLFSWVLHHAGMALNDDKIKLEALCLAEELLGDFYDPERDVFHEFVSLEGRRLNSPEGNVSVLGHVIEAMWFLIELYEDAGDTARINECVRHIKRNLELAWDEPVGGLRLAIDTSGSSEVAWDKADYKPWWVQIEAMIAASYASRYTNESWAKEWHERVREWAYGHYPVDTGEWTQWLDREGNPTSAGALPVKDPYHLPRGLIYLMKLWG